MIDMLLEEGICIVRNKKAAQRLLRDLKNSKGMSLEEIEKRAKRAKKMLEKGEKYVYKINL